MKRKYILAGLVAGALCLTAVSTMNFNQPSEAWAEDWNTVDRELDSFNSVRFSGAFEGEINVGSGSSIEISGSGDLDKKVLTRVKDGELEIIQVSNSWRDDAVEISISVDSLSAVTIDGAGELSIDGIDSDEFELRLPGAAEVEVSGSCVHLTIAIAGAASVDAESLECETAKISIAGTGEVSAYASKSADARISGLGQIEIYGDPESVERHISGLGKIDIN